MVDSFRVFSVALSVLFCTVFFISAAFPKAIDFVLCAVHFYHHLFHEFNMQ